MVTHALWRGCRLIWTCPNSMKQSSAIKAHQRRLIISWRCKDTDTSPLHTSPRSRDSSEIFSPSLQSKKLAKSKLKILSQVSHINSTCPLMCFKQMELHQMSVSKVRLLSGLEVRPSLVMGKRRTQQQMRRFKIWWTSLTMMTRKLIASLA